MRKIKERKKFVYREVTRTSGNMEKAYEILREANFLKMKKTQCKEQASVS